MTESNEKDGIHATGIDVGAVITQAQLKALKDAHDKRKAAEADIKKLRLAMLELYGKHADVEPGPLELRIDERDRQSIRRDDVVKVLGQDAMDTLLAAIPAITTYVVRVVDRETLTPEQNYLLFYEGWENE